MNFASKILFLLIFIAFSNELLSIGPPPPPPPVGGSTPPCWPPPCIPIDGGITFLLAAGAVYAGKKLYNNKKSKG